MEEKKFMLISIDDKRAKALSEVLGNKTCKKIIDFLSTQPDASETDISVALDIPLNTVNYNMKKLVEAELVEKTKNFFWSVKGKKIVMYRLSNKSIIIAPKNTNITSKIKSILPVFLIGALGAVLVRLFFGSRGNLPVEIQEATLYAGDSAKEGASLGVQKAMMEVANNVSQPISSNANFLFTEPSTSWIWFLVGAIFSFFLFAVWNWRKL